MPYIPMEEREKYDKLIESLADILGGLPNNDVLSGNLNYVFYRLALLLCDDSWPDSVGKRNYARMAVVSSALDEARTEFKRRIMAPYEDEKIKFAGDIRSRL